jgi:hypothetical protein
MGDIAMEETDYVSPDFKKLEDRLVSKNPPRIKWGAKYLEWDDKRKIQYLEKLASSMNQAAFIVQGERNQLNEICELKEEQLNKMTEAVRANNMMLQQEVTKMNEQRQSYNKHVSGLNAKIREMEKHGSDH